jgi:hypothetical protein
VFRIRPHSPLGLFPATPVFVDGAQLLYGDGIILSVVRIDEPEAHGIDGVLVYSELEFLALEEIRFLGCLGLALRPDSGMIYTYPMDLKADVSELLDPASIYETGRVLLGKADKQGFATPLLQSGASDHGFKYDRHERPIDGDMLTVLMAGVQLQDHLLVRGLSALLKADMLWRFREFAEAATITLHVAMEASFQLILRRLHSLGVQNPSASDAGRYLDGVFNPEIDSGLYFHGYYEDRIKAAHPSSRFGEFPFAPLSADDFYDLRSSLHAVFAFLITGRVATKVMRTPAWGVVTRSEARRQRH